MENNVTALFEQRISEWLEKEIQGDVEFAHKVKDSNKTVKGCCNFILSEVRKSGKCGFDDAEIFGLARHFFDESGLQDPGKQQVARIVVPGHVELTDEEKAEAKEKAKAEFEQEQLAKIKAQEKKRKEQEQKRKEERIRKQKEAEERQKSMQPSLFDF